MNHSSEQLRGNGLPRVGCGLGGINCLTLNTKKLKIISIIFDVLRLISFLSTVEGMAVWLSTELLSSVAGWLVYKHKLFYRAFILNPRQLLIMWRYLKVT